MEEIYETHDDQSSQSSQSSKISTHQHKPVISSEYIDSSELNPDNAFEIFASASNRLLGLSNNPINIDDTSSIYSKLDCNEKVLETPIQRFTRLRSELNDLEITLNNLQEYEVTNGSLISSWSKIQIETSKLKEFQLKLSINNNSNDVIDIEKRLEVLEQLLGYSSNTLDNKTSQMKSVYPILDIVSTLEGKSAYLEQGNIDSLKMKVYSLRKELESSSIRDTKINKISILDQKSTEYITKVDDMKKQIDQIENIVFTFPSLVLRLKSLESSHFKAASIAVKLNEIEEKVLSVKSNLLENSEVIDTLKSGLEENSTILKQNVCSMLQQQK